MAAENNRLQLRRKTEDADRVVIAPEVNRDTSGRHRLVTRLSETAPAAPIEICLCAAKHWRSIARVEVDRCTRGKAGANLRAISNINSRVGL